MEILGYLGAILIGVSLGLLGGGGSILAVPIFVYIFGINATLATAYSLFVVGFGSLLGAIPYYMQKQIDIRSVWIFGLPSMLTIFITRRYILPSIPQHLISIGDIEFTKEVMLLLFFALIMLIASYKMIKGTPQSISSSKVSHFSLVIQGLILGVVAGLVGAGGGFIIIPALVFFAKLPMKMAVGTSLAIISINSLLGFISDEGFLAYDWQFILNFMGITLIGLWLGTKLARQIDSQVLKPLFGYFVITMAIFIIIKELILK